VDRHHHLTAISADALQVYFLSAMLAILQILQEGPGGGGSSMAGEWQ
jgi:hypothetical protein